VSDLIDADYALRVDGEFVAAGRRGTAGSGASPSLVFSAQVALPAALRPAGRFGPSAGRDLVAGRVVPLEAEPAGRTWQQGPGQRASPAGEPGPGSRRPQRAAGRRGRCQRGQPGKRAL